MPNFSYKALGRDGKEVRGVLQAESEAAAASRIRENYPILLSISQKKEKKRPDDGSLLEMEIGSRRIKTKKLAILCSQFAITLHSGMTVARAMRMLADQNEDKRIRKIMGAAAEEVAAGSTVASALEKYSDRFPLTFIETIRAGEQSGTLEHSFDRLQKFYEKSYKTTEKIKGAMTYPLFVVAIAVVVLIIVMAKVIPTLADVFTDLGGTLPLMTRMLIATSHFFAKWWLLMLAVLAFLKIGSQVYGNTPQGRIEKAKIMLSLPLVGVINQMNGAAQFANTMSVLLAAGITINQAVDTTAKVMDNALLSEDVRSMREGIEQGRSLVECLRACAGRAGSGAVVFVAVSAGQMPLLWGKDPGGIVLGGTCFGDLVLSDRVPVRCFGVGTAGDTSVDCAFVPDAHGSACVDHTGSPAGGRSPDFFRNGSLSAGNGRTDIAWCSDGGWLIGRYAGTFTFI